MNLSNDAIVLCQVHIDVEGMVINKNRILTCAAIYGVITRTRNVEPVVAAASSKRVASRARIEGIISIASC